MAKHQNKQLLTLITFLSLTWCLFLAIEAVQPGKKKWNCDASEEDAVDRHFAKAIFGIAETFPTNEKSMQSFCR